MGACSSTPAVTAVDQPAAARQFPDKSKTAAVGDKKDEKTSVAPTHVSPAGSPAGARFSEDAGGNAMMEAQPPGVASAISNEVPYYTSESNKTSPTHHHHPSQDVSIGNFSTDSNSSNSSDDRGNFATPMSSKHGQNNSEQIDLSSQSHRRRKSCRNLTHSESKVGLDEIICGDLPNPNMVRIEVPLGKPIEEVYEGVHDGPVLGSGISGIVRLAKHRATQVEYAVKCLDLALIDSEEGLKQLKEEIYIMCQLDHPNIVRLEEVYESHSEIYLVQEVCKGGELFDRLDEQPDYHYTEAQCARLVKQMLSSVRYIHNRGIIHRDLKLENFLFSDIDSESELKMIDFGLSKHFTFGEVHHEAVGTPYTVAPEVIKGGYDERCDVWAIGVITYLLLGGEPPFGGCGGPETLLEVRDNILNGDYEFEPAEVWETVSQEAKDFIISLLVLDPLDRPTAQQATGSKWLKMWSNKDQNKEDKTINPNVVKALVGFKEYSDMRKLLCEVLSFTLLPEQIQGLRKEFEKYDVEGTGEITLDTLKKVLIGNASTGSLGGLTEDEVTDIFNAIRVRKGETSIHWHDFIAAGLSQCQVDDRNLRLAFDRLDPDHKGYITFENVIDLMGGDTFGNEDQMLKMWGDSMKNVNGSMKDVNLRFEDFVLLMKGQKLDRRSMALRSSLTGLDAVLEGVEGLEIPDEDDDEHVVVTPLSLSQFPLPFREEPDMAGDWNPKKLSPKEASPDLLGSSPARQFMRMGSNSAPVTPLYHGRRFDESDEGDSPLVTSEGRLSLKADFNENQAFQMPDLDLTPPQTPVRGAMDFCTPTVARATMDTQFITHLSPPDLTPGIDVPTENIARGRSVSLDEKDKLAEEAEQRRGALYKHDSRRAMRIPEHTHIDQDIDMVIGDETKTPLVVNRALYRAHREFRRAVTDACKRFEDEQMRRAKDTLQAQENAVARHTTAGLVMRHGQALTEQSIKTFLKKTLDEQQKKVDQASRRGGRGRRNRKKTVSDMSGMMSAPALPESTEKVAEAKPKKEALAPVKENENLLRNPTKPGEFRKTNYDPFRRESLFAPPVPSTSQNPSPFAGRTTVV